MEELRRIAEECRKHKYCIDCPFGGRGMLEVCMLETAPEEWNLEEIEEALNGTEA